MISDLAIKKKGFEILFQDGKARLKTKGSSSIGVMIGIKERFHRARISWVVSTFNPT